MKIRDGKLPEGKGMFVWILKRCAGGDMQNFVKMCKAAELKWVSIKVADGTSIYKGSWYLGFKQQSLLDELVPLLKAASIEVHFWGYTYGVRPGKEVGPIIEMITKHRPCSYSINAEHEYKCPAGKQASIDHASGIRWAMSVSSSDDIPDIPIGLSSYRWPSVHPEFPWKEFMPFIDFHNPQVYWQGADNPGAQLTRSVNELKKLKDIQIIPAGTMYPHGSWKPTPGHILEFCEMAQMHGLLAVHFWEWYYAEKKYPELWKALAEFNWDPGEPPPPPLPPPQPDCIAEYNQALETYKDKIIEIGEALKR